jgi:hypothetical protein
MRKRTATAAAASRAQKTSEQGEQMKLPEEIRLGSHTIPVVRKKGLIRHSEACGIFDEFQQTIYVDEDLTGSAVFETFWHEVVEAINYYGEMSLPHQSIQVFGLLLHQVIDSIQADPEGRG